MKRITQVRKRDGRLVPFDLRRVADAIYRAAQSVGGEDRFLSEELAGVVGLWLERHHGGRVPGIEDVEQAVEKVLVETGHARTAKAFILHRDRRRAARERVEVEDDTPGERPLPLVGSDAGGPVSAWSKARVVAALVEEAGLEAPLADEVARAVEQRVLASGLPRVASSLVRALVDAELFARGRVRSLERQRVVGLPKRDLAARIEEGLSDRRVLDPPAIAEALGEEMLRRYVLEERVPPAVAEAHRLGEIHLEDLGTPFSLPVVSLAIDGLLERHLRGEETPRALGARRFQSALADVLERLGRIASRRFVLEDVNVHWAPFVDRLDDDALHAEARELLLSPAVLSWPRRSGLCRLELVLSAEVPARLVGRPVLPPAPPGLTLGDVGDAALRAARALLAAAAELRREGAGERLPDLSLVVPRGGPRDPAARALLQDALALAAEGGEPVFLLDAAGLPSRGGRDLRVGPDDHQDPFRHAQGDVSLASLVAINLVGPALKTGRVETFLDEMDRLGTLAVDGATARRDGLLRQSDAPGGGLWTLRRGLIPVLDLESAVHAIEIVGLERALDVLLPDGGPSQRAALRSRTVARLESRVAAAVLGRDLVTRLVERGASEAAVRFAEVDAARYDTARGWWGRDETPTYAHAVAVRPGATRVASGAEPAGRGGGPARILRRVETDRRLPPEVLRDEFETAAADLRVIEFAVDPWPRRILRPAADSP